MSNVKAPMEVEVSNKALKLAKEWVNKMNNGSDGGNEEVEGHEPILDIRPSRLGLGAKFVPHSNINATVTPIEKKLRAKLQTSKTNQDLIPCKAQKGMDKSSEANVEHDVSDGEEDSKSSCFSKKDTSKSSKAHLIQEFQNGRKKRKKG